MVKSYSVLIVDDSKSLRLVVKKLIESTDYLFKEIYEAGHGREALDIVEKHEVDIIFTDINMPVMNGIEFIKAMRLRPIQIPMVVISTDGSQETVIEAIKSGAKGYIKKPFSANKVKEILEKTLK